MAEEMVEEGGSVEEVKTPAAAISAESEDTVIEKANPRKMSREDLDTFLGKGPEGISTDLTEEVEGSETGEESTEEETSTENNEVTDDTDESDTVTSEDIKALMAENKRLLKKTENQDKFFDRVGTEVGLLRKKTPEEDKVELERIRDLYIDDPVAGHKAMVDFNASQEKAETVGREVEVNRRIEVNKTGIESLIPDFETNQSEIVEEIAGLMTEDGAPAAAVAAFKEQPFLMDQATLYNLHLRNTIGKESKEKDAKITELETQIEELKKRPGELLSNIEKASKNQTLTGKSAGAVPANSTTVQKKPAKMSRAELKKIINKS